MEKVLTEKTLWFIMKPQRKAKQRPPSPYHSAIRGGDTHGADVSGSIL